MDLSNLLSGLIGAIIGVASSLGIYLFDRDRSERAAIRAVILEASVNQIEIKSLLDGRRDTSPVTNTVYLANLTLLAAKLPIESLGPVALAYAHVPACEAARGHLMSGRALSRDELATARAANKAFDTAKALLQEHAGWR